MFDCELEPTADDSSRVHVCAFIVTRYGRLFGEIVTWLSPEEQKRPRHFLKEGDRTRFVLGRGIVRFLCAEHLGTDPAAIKLDQSSTGKPYLVCQTEVRRGRLEFNVAHSGDCVLVGWSPGQCAGVDVEAIDRHPPTAFDGVSAIAFSDAERAALSAAAPDQIVTTFYRIWVRKEAVLKAEGCGFSGSLQSFSVARQRAVRAKWIEKVRYPASGRTWRIVDLAPALNHLGAIAMPEGSTIHHYKPVDTGVPWF
jgi:4'-phosphopantetheinyl transferase